MSSSAILEKLAKGGFTLYQKSISSYLKALFNKLNAKIEVMNISECTIRFVARFKSIFLNGMDEVQCLIVTGDKNGRFLEENNFHIRKIRSGTLPFVFYFNDSHKKLIKKILPEDGCLFLDSEQTNEIFSSPSPLDILKNELRNQISMLTLNPYTISKPTKGNLFFGREKELELLKRQKDISFGIVGPTRIGKSSLANRLYNLRKIEKANDFYTVAINCYGINNLDSDSVARFIAQEIESSKRAFNTSTNGLIQFLRYCRWKFDSKIELIIDEVDAVCETEAFKKLGEAAKSDLCRLILCGKSTFFKKALQGKNPYEARLKFLTLKPLNEKESFGLIKEPMLDLGFNMGNEKEQKTFLEKFYKLTGGMSHLIQLFCDKIIEEAFSESDRDLNWSWVETVKMDFTIAQYVMSPLNDLSDEETRKVAWELFKRNPVEISNSLFQKIINEMGIQCNDSRLREIRNDLVINNIIIHKDTEISLPNKALFEYARTSGFKMKEVN